MKLRKLITPLLINVMICATLALGFRQDPLGSSIHFSGPAQTQDKNDRPVDVKDLYLRITKLESKVTQLEMRIDEMQRPRVVPLNNK
jgi:hypothetical protein